MDALAVNPRRSWPFVPPRVDVLVLARLLPSHRTNRASNGFHHVLVQLQPTDNREEGNVVHEILQRYGWKLARAQ